MDRKFYLDLAARGLRMPIGSDLILHEENDPEQVRKDGRALGQVIARAARRWGTPLAVPLMDLRLEKIDLLSLAGISAAEAESFHFTSPLDEDTVKTLCGAQTVPACVESLVRDEALAYIRTQPDLLPVGMAIGPFSLTTQLLADPITVTALAGMDGEAGGSDDVRLLWQCLRVSEAAVVRSVQSQIRSGAKAIMVCEAAACTAFISPRQMESRSNLFERLVMEPNLRLKAVFEEGRCDLIFHDCGELTDSMVQTFAHRLHPAILSFGGSRKLWEDARLVPKDVVLYGNLPSKSFYSDDFMPLEEVIRRTNELATKMKACGHPHILGTECDVLFVPEAQDTIWKKVEAMNATVTPPDPVKSK